MQLSLAIEICETADREDRPWTEQQKLEAMRVIVSEYRLALPARRHAGRMEERDAVLEALRRASARRSHTGDVRAFVRAIARTIKAGEHTQ